MIETSVMRRDWADINFTMFLGWIVQKDVKYSTSFFFTLAVSHKQLETLDILLQAKTQSHLPTKCETRLGWRD